MRRLIQKISKLADKFLEFLFPQECISCKKEGNFVCKNCAASIKSNLKNSFKNKYFLKIYPLASWNDETIKQSIRRLKFKFAKRIVKDLECFYSKILNKIKFQEDAILVPVPLHALRKNERGFNQSEILAKSFSDIINIPVKTDLIKRVINTYPQSKLKGFERRNNLKNAFIVNKEKIEIIPKNTPIYLVDDIASTLTTLNECALQFKRTGFKNIYAIVLARGE